MKANAFNKIPFGGLGIIALKSCHDLGNSIDSHLLQKRNNLIEITTLEEDLPETYLISVNEVRFANGEGKVSLRETVRGKDIYILCDIGNYSCTYKLFGIDNHMGPDEHFQDIKRVLSAIAGKARRITLIMPFLYEGRQHKRKGRESLDCSIALQELERMGVDNIITFDAHDPTIQNAIPLIGFESVYPTFEIIKNIMEKEKGSFVNRSNMIVISPDTGAMDRAIYYSSVLGVDVGLFYKRRDYSKIVNGKNPIVQHEYIGSDIAGKDILIVDDMIASGESILDIARDLKKRGANNIYAAVTFALFTEGPEKFKNLYEEGIVKRVYSTNLTHIPEEVRKSEWFTEVDMSLFISELIDTLNYDESISPLLNGIDEMEKILKSSGNNA
jgi:ribose-phosphate pyrophosphokinase